MRARARDFIEELIRGELDTVLLARVTGGQDGGDEASADVIGHRHGRRTRSLTGTFGPIEIAVPRAKGEHRRRQDDGVEEQGAAGLPAAHARR